MTDSYLCIVCNQAFYVDHNPLRKFVCVNCRRLGGTAEANLKSKHKFVVVDQIDKEQTKKRGQESD